MSATTAHEHLRADDFVDGDSLIGDNLSVLTQSLQSCTLSCVKGNGRSYRQYKDANGTGCPLSEYETYAWVF